MLDYIPLFLKIISYNKCLHVNVRIIHPYSHNEILCSNSLGSPKMDDKKMVLTTGTENTSHIHRINYIKFIF